MGDGGAQLAASFDHCPTPRRHSHRAACDHGGAVVAVTDTDINVGGTSVPAGKYTVFTIPEESKWTLIISKKTGEWGTAYPGQSNDLARIDMKVSKLPSPTEDFTIALDQSGSTCVLHMDWETTRASVDITKK